MNVKALFLSFCLFFSFAAFADQVDPRSTTGQSLNFPTDQVSTVIVDSLNDSSYTYPVIVACNKADDSPRNSRKIILAVHGFVHDRDAWTYMGDYVLENFGDDVYKFCAIDLPGHGGSGWDPTVSYGRIPLSDYIYSLDKTIDFLNEENDLTDGDLTLYGHSLGGMVIQLLQHQLTIENSSLADKNVSSVVLWESVFPTGVRWPESKTPSFLVKFMTLVNIYSGGIYGSTTNNDYWTRLFFTDKDTRKVVYDGLPEDDIAYLNNTEPGQAALEMVGLDQDLKRPVVNAGIFAPEFGVDLFSVNFDKDQYVSISGTQDLHSYLTNTPSTFCGTDLDSTPCISVPSLPHDGIVNIALSSNVDNAKYLDSIVRNSL